MERSLDTAHTGVSEASIASERAGILRFSATHLLVALVLLIVAAPFFEEFGSGDLIEALLFTLVLVFAVLSVGGRRRDMVFAIILVVPTIAAKWGNRHLPQFVPAEAFRIGAILFLAFIVAHLLRFVLHAPRVNSEVISAAISAYLLIGVIWALAYMLAAELVPGSFVVTAGPASSASMTGFNGVYFSFVTLSTVGYGDLVPVSKVARMLAMTEAMTGVFYVAILISRLVALYAPRRGSDHTGR